MGEEAGIAEGMKGAGRGGGGRNGGERAEKEGSWMVAVGRIGVGTGDGRTGEVGLRGGEVTVGWEGGGIGGGEGVVLCPCLRRPGLGG